MADDLTTPPIGREASIPNPSLEPLKSLLGEWQTTGAHPLVPDTTLHGRVSFAWMDGGAFLVMRTEIDEPNFPSGIAVFGSDDETGEIYMLYFDERGVSRKYDVTVSGNQLAWRRDNSKFSQTFTIDIGERAMKGVGKMSRDGGPWEDDLSLTYVRIS